MKAPITIFLLFLSSCIFSQNHDISLDYRFGIATNELSSPTPKLNTSSSLYRGIQSIYDQGITLSYKYKIWKKIGLYIYGGFEVSNSKHYFKIVEYPRRYLANVIIKQNRYALKFGLNKEFKLYNGRLLLDLGIHFVDRYYFTDSKRYTQGLTQSYVSWQSYSYDLETLYGEYYLNHGVENRGYLYLNLEYALNLKFKLNKQLYFNFGFNYSRNNIFFYNYNYTIVTNYTDGTTSTYTNLGLVGPSKYAVRDHFIYANFGLSYKFNWKK